MSTALRCAASTYFVDLLRDALDRLREVVPLERLRVPPLRERLRAVLRDGAAERVAELPLASPERAPW
jgi:hypothetical protein